MNDSYTQRILAMPPKRDLSRSLMLIPTEDITPNPRQPRREFSRDELSDLMSSIAQHGLIQPLTVRPTEHGFELVAGEGRLRACIMLGMREIPCVIKSVSAEQSGLMALIENVQRRDLSCIEEAEAYKRLLVEFGMTQEQLGVKLGKSQSYLSNKLRLLRLPESVREKLYSGELSERHARAMLALGSEEAQFECANRVIAGKWSVRKTEEFVTEQLKVKPAKIRCLVRNDRLIINAINDTVAKLKDSGANIAVRELKQPDGTDLIISIRK